MCDSKSDIKHDVLRPNCPEAIERVPKGANSAMNCHMATPLQAQGTSWADCTTMVQDVALDFNSYVDKSSYRDAVPSIRVSKSRGSDLVDMLLRTVSLFFEHPNAHTAALVADQDVFGTPAKRFVQDERAKKADEDALKAGIEPLVWNRWEPTAIIMHDSALPSMTAIRATPGAMRHVIYETMRLAVENYRPPANKRVIYHYVDYDVIIPERACDWLPPNAEENAFIVEDEWVEYVGFLRSALVELSQVSPPRVWRKECFDLAKSLCECGAIRYHPLCVETNAMGVTMKPFRLTKFKMKSAEADTAMARYVNFLYTGEIHQRLVGPRVPLSISRSAPFQSREERASIVAAASAASASTTTTTTAAASTVGSNFYIGPQGQHTAQRCIVISVDTDMITLLLTFFAVMVANYDWSSRQDPEAESAYAVLAPHAPLLLMGEVYTKPDKNPQPGVPPRVGTRFALGYDRWFELLDIGKLYALVTRRGSLDKYMPPLGAAMERFRQRQEAALVKRAATRESNKRKRAAVVGGVPEPESAAAEERDPEPVIRLPPLHKDATIEQVFARAMNFCLFVWMQGNDYLAGLTGVSRDWAYIGFCEFLYHERHLELFRTSIEVPPPEPDACRIEPLSERAPPLRLLAVDKAGYATLTRYCYYCNLQLQHCKTNKTSSPVQALDYGAVAALVAKKWTADPRKHMPNEERLELRWRRLVFLLYMAIRGPTSISGMIDPERYGYDGPNSAINA